MNGIPLTLACGAYDRTEALRTGDVIINGVELTYIADQWPVGIFSKMIRDQAFDVAEMSLIHALVLKARNQFPFVTIPVFPSRYFRHGLIFVNKNSEIREPKDLEGKRIGVQGYQMTAAVWIRGILRSEYSVSLDDVQWFEGGVNQPTVPGGSVTALKPDRELRIDDIAEGKTLSDMLAEQELDALIGAIIPASLHTSGHVQRLFPDYVDREREYFSRTGIFPIMHTLVIKESLCSEHPWLAESVYTAFDQAKAWAYKKLRFSGSLRYMFPWLFEHLEDMDNLFKSDAWVYGLEANRNTLETFAQFLLDDDFLREELVIDEAILPMN